VPSPKLQNKTELAVERAARDSFKLLFVCAHPAVDASIRQALMLQAVLGLEAQEIAAAMLTSPSPMAQRLVRAKQKIRDTKIRFEEPNKEDFPNRLHSVLEAIYAAYGLGWEAVDGGEDNMMGLRSEALFLCGLAEALGLLALMLFCDCARRATAMASGALRQPWPIPARSGDSIGPLRTPKQWSHTMASHCRTLHTFVSNLTSPTKRLPTFWGSKSTFGTTTGPVKPSTNHPRAGYWLN
jgi:hypothetical protein